MSGHAGRRSTSDFQLGSTAKLNRVQLEGEKGMKCHLKAGEKNVELYERQYRHIADSLKKKTFLSPKTLTHAASFSQNSM